MTKSTASDEERLRRALSLIGEEAGRPGPATADRSPARRRKGFRLAPVLAVSAAASVIAVLVFGLVTGDGGTGTDEAGQGQTEAEGIACARLIAEGEVVAVEEADTPDRIILTFDVQDPIRPAGEIGLVELEMVDPAVVDPQHALRPGDQVLLEVQQRLDYAPSVTRGSEIEHRRAVIEQALPEAADTACPPYWQEEGASTASVPGDA